MATANPVEGLSIESLQNSLLIRFPYLNKVNYRLLTSVPDIEAYLDGMKSGEPLVLDLETTGLNAEKHHIVGVALSYREAEGVYIPIRHTQGEHLNVSWEPLRDILNRVFNGDSHHPMIPYNWKFEGNFLERAGVVVKEVWDCMVSAFLNDPNRRVGLKDQTHFLYNIKQVDFGDCFPDVKKRDWNFANVHPEIAYLYACGDVDFTLRIWNTTAGAREDQSVVWKFENRLTEVLRRMENNGFYLDINYLRRVELELSQRIEILRERIYRVMGREVTRVVKKTRVKRHPETGESIKDPQTGKSIKETVEEKIVSVFNVDSASQVGKKLFGPVEEGGMGIVNPARTSTGKMATSEAVIASMEGDHPVISDVLLYRKLVKCNNTYIRHLLLDSDADGRGKFAFLQCHAPTGRLSASKGGNDSGYVGMNVQSTPAAIPVFTKGWVIDEWVDPTEGTLSCCLNPLPTHYLADPPVYLCQRTECECVKQGKAKGHWEEKVEYWETPNVRRAFVGRKGFLVVAIDYSGIELRIAANLSKEPAWVNEFLKLDPDLHRATAIVVYGPDVVESPDFKVKRGHSKTLNFLSLYGGSGKAAAAQIEGMSPKEGDKLVADFFKGLPVLNAWINGMHAHGRKTRQVQTYFKRRRPLHMYEDNDPRTRDKSCSFGDRSSVSTAIQGTAADIMKIALVRLDRAISKRGWQEYVRMLLTIHDECVFEVREDKIEEIVPVLVESMAFPVVGWPVPLVCDVEIGRSWGEGKEHRLVDGKLMLHSDITKAIQEGRSLSSLTEGGPGSSYCLPLPSILPEEAREEPEEYQPPPDPKQRVTLLFRSVLTEENVRTLRELIMSNPGPTPLVLVLAGHEARYSVEETVSALSLLRECSEKGLSVVIEA